MAKKVFAIEWHDDITPFWHTADKLLAVLMRSGATKVTEVPSPDLKWRKKMTANRVVQIDPAHDECFGACFMVVTEKKSWGVIGYIQVPGKGDKGGQAWYRCPNEAFTVIGNAEWYLPPTEEVNEHGSDSGAPAVETSTEAL